MPTTTTPNPSDPYGGLSGAQRDIAVAVTNLFNAYGLGTLAPKILDFVKQGYSADTISILLQDTDEYKQRFAANQTRIKAGLPALSPAEYLQTESAYRQILRAAGVPAGFYDQSTDFQKFLELDVSPTELQSRVTDAENFINRADPNEKAFFNQYYSKGDMIAYALDPTRAEPLIGKAFEAAMIGGQASHQNITISQSQAEQLAGLGLSQTQASQGFSLIAGEMPNANKLAQISGEQGFTTQDLINETFNNANDVAQRRARLASEERARFGGSSAVIQGSLSSNDGGQF